MGNEDENKKSAVAPSKKELVAVAEFPYPWSNNAEEVKALDDGKWNPSDRDFLAVAHKDAKSKDVYTVTTLGEFLGVIDSAKDGTLERLVLITHSKKDLIALSGTMQLNSIKGNVGLNQSNSSDMLNSGGIDQSVVNWLNDDQTEGRPQRDHARTKFSVNAEIVLISCHSGSFVSLPPFLMDLSAALNVRIKGFNEEISYFPRYNKNSVTDRTFTAVSMTGTQASGFRHMLSNSAIKSFKAKTPTP
ncbi:MAG TPA: hypothetical protein VHO70_17945 [Chitinispirillaceae bacterium]|nr:hypothetical protein [Chitinispirillaceae bacterium]